MGEKRHRCSDKRQDNDHHILMIIIIAKLYVKRSNFSIFYVFSEMAISA